MNKNEYFRLILIMWFLALSNCQFGCTAIENNIEKIDYPGKLPVELHDKSIYFFKSNGTGSELAIRTLSLSEINYYQNSYYIPFIDVSNDGQIMVYAQIAKRNGKRPFLLWKYSFIDGRERRIAGWDDDYSVISISNPVFSHDDKNILFSVTWYMTGKTGIARVKIDGEDLFIFETDIPLAEGPEPSPDGSKILVTCAGVNEKTSKLSFQICLLDEEGKFIRYVSTTGDGHGSYYFTPDGYKIVYTEFEFGGLLGIINKPKYRLIVYDLNTRNRSLLLNWELSVKGFSNDSQQIILEGRPNDKSPWGIYIINIDGTNLRHLAYFDAFLKDWYEDFED